jgi:hypothetical protein
MKKVLKKDKRGNKKERLVTYEKMSSLNENSTRIELFQMLIPVGLQAIEKELQSEVSKLAGVGYTRTHPDLKRWGCQRGISIFRRSEGANSSFSCLGYFRGQGGSCYVWNQECSFREGCDPALPMPQTGENLKITR